MANTYYSINPTTGTIAEISTALQAKYGAGITIHYESDIDLIFSCAAMSNKVTRINTPSTNCRVYYGTAWTSGTTITDSSQWAGLPSSSAATAIDMVLGANTMFLLVKTSVSYGTMILLIGKLTNDEYALLSACPYSSSIGTRCLNSTTGETLQPRCFPVPFASASGKLFAQPIHLITSSGAIAQNTDSSIASFMDVENVSAAAGTTALVSTNYMMSPAPVNYNGGNMQTSIIATF